MSDLAMFEGARFLLPWNHGERWPDGDPINLRRRLLRVCRIDRVALRRLPAGPEREVVSLQLRCRQRSLARSRLSRSMLTYGVALIGTEPWWALYDEHLRQGELRAADEAAWRSIQRRAQQPDPLEVIRRRGRAGR
jgi:hypothetical protein